MCISFIPFNAHFLIDRKASTDDDAKTPQVEILSSEMPEVKNKLFVVIVCNNRHDNLQGAVSTGDEDDGNKGDDLDVAHRALNINLDEYVIICHTLFSGMRLVS